MGKGSGNEVDSKGFTKTDMERMGIFNEMGYITIGDNYKSSRSCKYQEFCIFRGNSSIVALNFS